MIKYNIKQDLIAVPLNNPVGDCSKCYFRDAHRACHLMVCMSEGGLAVYWKMAKGGKLDALLAVAQARCQGVDIAALCRQKIAAAYSNQK